LPQHVYTGSMQDCVTIVYFYSRYIDLEVWRQRGRARQRRCETWLV